MRTYYRIIQDKGYVYVYTYVLHIWKLKISFQSRFDIFYYNQVKKMLKKILTLEA